MYKLAKEVVGMFVGICIIWMSVNFYIKMSDAEKNNEHFNPVKEGVRIIKETADDAVAGWQDTTNVNK
tara:strand:+ start:205 stop:408 length:204 start_codon:yes stop_codon:yes gene_type:complete